MKLKGDALETWELEKFQTTRQQEMLQKEAQFKHSKQQELLALQKRIQSGREEQKKQRHQDLERLVFLWKVKDLCLTVIQIATKISKCKGRA